MKKVLCLLLSMVMLSQAASATNLWDEAPASDETVESGTEEAIEQSIDQADGQLVNPDPDHSFTDAQATEYSYTPLDVVLVLDTSGSMGEHARGGQEIISLAQEAAAIFVETLFGLSAPSRIGLVAFESDAHQLTGGFLGLTDETGLKQMIRSTYASGQTNTGGAFRLARQMLNTGKRTDARQVVVMLTDGIPVGSGDPVRTAIEEGRALGNTDTLVYTIGLVGALSDQDKQITRSVLHDGYEVRYFEVDSRGSGSTAYTDAGGYTYIAADDIARGLSDVFKSICMSAISDDEESGIYSLWVDETMEIRVAEKNGTDYLSSDPMDYRESAGFGRLNIVGEGKSSKSVTLRDGDYIITLRGNTTGRGSYGITRLQGYRMRPTALAEAKNANTHPAQVLRFDLHGDTCEMTDLSWDPLDHTATDSFTGKPTRGSETAASGRISKADKLYAWRSRKAVSLLSLAGGAFVQVLASDADASWYLCAIPDKDGKLTRGWVPAQVLKVDGYVPVLVQDPEKTFRVTETSDAMNAPAETSSSARTVKKGEKVTAIHAERDIEGREWAYVLLEGKKEQAAWIPASSLDGWESVSPEGFRIGYALPTLVWQTTTGGKGFTEFMWAASQKDGSGTVLSGRTSSSSGSIRAKYKNRDALALLLSPEGTIETSTVVGGTGDMDSFHCIVPVDDGFFVSGVTRSNDKDFAGIWDRETFSGSTGKTSKRSSALIGKLNPDLSIDWLKSFGVGSKSYGFDMVVETADGMIAGSGWLTADSSFLLRGNGKQDFLIMKFDREGNLLDCNNYGGSDDDVPDSAVATGDGGLILVGSLGGVGHATGQIFVTDSALRQINRLTYGGSQDDTFDNIRDLGDGTYIVTGFTASYSSSFDFWAMQIDAMGRMIWSKTYGGSGREEVCGTTVFPNGSILLVGSTTSTDGNVHGGTGKGKDAWAVCIDPTGRILWQFTGSLAGDDYFNSAAIDPADGGIVLCGTCEYKSDKNAKGYAVKIMPPEPVQ